MISKKINEQQKKTVRSALAGGSPRGAKRARWLLIGSTLPGKAPKATSWRLARVMLAAPARHVEGFQNIVDLALHRLRQLDKIAGEDEDAIHSELEPKRASSSLVSTA